MKVKQALQFSEESSINGRRNLGVELYRTLLMFGICVLHVAAICPNGNSRIARMLEPCVVGFAFISGYYGVKFSVGRILKLYGYAIACALISVLMEPMLIGGGLRNIFIGVLGQITDYWYLHAYVIMMIFAPVLNTAPNRSLLPIVFLALGWSFCSTFALSKGIVPHDPSFSAFSGLTLIGIYAFARLYKSMNLSKYIDSKLIWLLIPILLAASAVGLGRYNSPIAVLLAAIFFTMFERMQLTNHCIAVILRFLGPSVFAIYLIQTTTCGFVWMHNFGGHWFFASLILFAGCLLLDLHRRIVIKSVKLVAMLVGRAQLGKVSR